MRTAEAHTCLTSLRPDRPDIVSEIGTRDDTASLRLQIAMDPDRWALVNTPGDRWFSLNIDGAFSLDYYAEDETDDEVRSVLTRYVKLAVLYLDQRPSPRRTGLFRLPAVTIRSHDGPVVLRRSVATTLRHPLRLHVES